MLIGVLGAGALGGLYGARLAKSGCSVHFLFHSDYEKVKKEGLRIESVWGDFTLQPVNAYASVEDLPLCDVVVIGLKTTQNIHLKDWIPKILRPGGHVITLQNGLGVEEYLAEITSPAQVWGGLCFLCSTKVGPGHIRHVDYGYVKMGCYRSPPTKALKEFAQLFEKAGIPVGITEDLIKARWQKLVWNIPYNGLSVLLNADTRQMMDHPETAKAVEQLMLEVTGSARGDGHPIPKDFVDKMLRDTLAMKPYKTSMMVDYERGAPLELESMYRVPMARAHANDISIPRIETLYAQLTYLDQKNQK